METSGASIPEGIWVLCTLMVLTCWDEKGRRSLEKISRHTYSAMADGVLAALHSLDPAFSNRRRT
jgi:hypothetical protein